MIGLNCVQLAVATMADIHTLRTEALEDFMDRTTIKYSTSPHPFTKKWSLMIFKDSQRLGISRFCDDLQLFLLDLWTIILILYSFTHILNKNEQCNDNSASKNILWLWTCLKKINLIPYIFFWKYILRFYWINFISYF